MNSLSRTDNPYANALEGLQLDDPVRAFFDFCRAREQIRKLRESGVTPPWTDDPILAKGRFLNVFREDDRGTKALFRFVAPVIEDLTALVHAVFFARWCNRPSTLNALTPAHLSDPDGLAHTLEELQIQPWCNVTAYPVEPAFWRGKRWSRFETATQILNIAAPALTAAIVAANGDVIAATAKINSLFKMPNDFPIFMAVMDLAWFRPDVINPASQVPTGIGAAPFLDRLQAHLGLDDHQQTCDAMMSLQTRHWPDAKRPLLPIDVEYLACECRKYYSYLNGTKQLDGKNVFRPGERPRLLFDVPASDGAAATVHTQIHVIAGGPCSGKTTLMAALEAAGYRVVAETAERKLQAGIAAGSEANTLRADPVSWQREVLAEDYAVFEALPVDELLFTDTSFIEDLVFAERAGLAIGPNLLAWLRRKRYRAVFFVEPLATYAQTDVRLEDREVANRISAEVFARYRVHGYEPVVVPAMPIKERLDFVLERL